jgi:hypothetical protein
MRLPDNIDKSAFRHGDYVGYGGGIVWRITKSTGSYGKWFAYPANDPSNKATFYAWTLPGMSEKLKQVKQG